MRDIKLRLRDPIVSYPAEMYFFERKYIHISRLSPRLLVCIALLFPLKLLGAEQSAGQSQPSSQHAQPPTERAPSSGIFDSLDTSRDYLSDKFVGYVSDIDRFFGDERHYQESNTSVIQMDITRVSGYSGDDKFVLSARAKLDLPSTEKRLHLLLETNPDQNINGAPPQDQNLPAANQTTTPQSYGAALRYEKSIDEIWHFSTDTGLKFQGIHIDPFVRARGSFSAPFDEWRFKATETAFWFHTIGAGETTQIDLEHSISEPILFRASSYATWLNDTQNFDLRQDLSFYQSLNERTALLYQASAIGVSNPQLQVTDYVLLIDYRYRLHKKWVYFELSPQLHFPREKDFQSSPAIIMRLEMLFDESR